MNIKITLANLNHLLFRASLTIVMLLFTLNLFSQTITDVFPTRVTTGSTVTIIGIGFTNTTRDNISISGIAITNKTLVSSTEMTFEISQNTGGDNLNRDLTIGGGVNVADLITYIAPRSRSLTTSAPFFVKEIYTNWDYNGRGFWSSNDWKSLVTQVNDASPNDSHELLGYKMQNDIIYSTGVDDALLESKLVQFNVLTQAQIDAQLVYKRKVFKAYSTNGVQGKTNSANYILTGDLLDNLTGSAENATNNNLTSLTNINNISIFESIIDGRNGLELGTGISNFNNTTDVRFYSGNGQPGAIGDNGTPDLLISQIAQAGGTDIYHYADNFGNVVGYPLKLTIAESGSTKLANWKLDLYSFPNNQPFSSARPNKRGFTSNDNEFRPIRFAAFQLEDFGITTAADVAQIENVNMAAGGTADIAFMAYNNASFDIKAPVARPLLPGFVCKLDGSASVTFTTDAGIDIVSGAVIPPSGLDDRESLSYEWAKYNVPETPAATGASFTISNVDANDLATYKVKISNAFGTIILPVDLSQGGTPYTYSGGTWSSPYGFVTPEERGLLFAGDYSENVDLEGCDCKVASGVNVTIPTGKKVKLYGAITVDPEVPFVAGVTSFVPAGQFTLENNASLIQTKTVTTNENSGAIRVQRLADNLHTNDFVYWSSPVSDFNLSSIPGNNGFRWETNTVNALGTAGNWMPYSGLMEAGRGYIKRVPSAVSFTNTFVGKPNNGPLSNNVYKSTTGTLLAVDNRHWNLVGNPYPSALNATKFLTDNTNIEGSVNLWTHNTEGSINPANSPYYQNFVYNYGNQYVTFNGTASVPAGFAGFIGSGQGFFVKVLEASAPVSTVNFTNDMRYDGAQNAHDNTQFYRSNENVSTTTEESEVEKQLIWLSLVNESNTASIALIGYVQGATNGTDRLYDAGINGESMSIYSTLEDAKMIIQGRALPFQESDIVPLGIDIPNNGLYKIGIDTVEGSLFVDQEQSVYLEDTYSNIIHDLKIEPYTFTATTGSITDRFVLRYTSETLSVNDFADTDTFVFIKNAELNARSLINIDSIQIYDLAGKQLITYKVDNSNSYNAPFEFPRGVYLATIEMENGQSITKKLIN